MKNKILIVGGVAGGATAAARLRRLSEHSEIVLVERGEHISFANCGLPYYIGGSIKDHDDLLLTTPEELDARYNIDVRTSSEVLAINRPEKSIKVRDLVTQKSYVETYDKLILSPGAEPVKPKIPGSDLDNIFTLRDIPDTNRIKTFIERKKPSSAVVVGGGFIGLEMAENLSQKGIKTTLIEKLKQVMPPFDFEMAAILHDHIWENGVVLDLENSVTQFSKRNGQIHVKTENGYELPCDMVLLSVGVIPESKLARDAGLSIGPGGGIKIDATMRTSDPDIYAVGDAVMLQDFLTGDDILLPLAGPANKQGRIAAENTLGRVSSYQGAMGTAIVKIFAKSAACTGMNEKKLLASNIPYLKSYTFSGSHASYYPNSETICIKLMFSPEDGKILGAQVIGGEGVDKRMDILATAIYAGMTVYDLEKLDLAYAPPFSSAKDPVNIAGNVAANILKEDLEIIHWHDIDGIDRDKNIIVDLRTRKEIDMDGTIDQSIHIPIEELRARMDELDRAKPIITYCAIGMRGYLGYRILTQNGFNVRSLSGGFEIYKNTLPL